MNFYFKNECKNEFEDNNEKSSNRFKIGFPLEIDFRADWTHESNPTGWELIKNLGMIFEKSYLKVHLLIDHSLPKKREKI